MRTFALIAIVPCVSGHGVLTMPMSRNGGNPANPADYYSTMYYTAPTRQSGGVKITDRDLLTEFRYGTDDNPWRAPGTAPVWSPCGMYCDNCASPDGRDGRDLAKTAITSWRSGSEVEVGFGMNTNHGGGYAYRLCKADQDQSEDCFAANYLEFVGDKSWIQVRDNRNDRTEFTAKRTTQGVGGSQWTKNPVPNNCNGADCPFPPPVTGLYGHTHQTNTKMLEKINIVDKVKIPANLPLGDYTLSWRWDAEETTQVWSNCADVAIVGKNAPIPDPAPAPSPSPSLGGGGGSSNGCVDQHTNCGSAQCCSDPALKCYKKDDHWNGCVSECIQGQIQASDPPQYQTPWDCALLDNGTGPRPAPSPPSEPESEPENEPESEPESEPETEACVANLGPSAACRKQLVKKGYCVAASEWHAWMMKNCCKLCQTSLIEHTKFAGRMVAEVNAHGALDISEDSA